MAKKVFNAETLPSTVGTRMKDPTLSINATNGFFLNKLALDVLGLKGKETAKIEFEQDEETPDNWSLKLGDKGFLVKISEDGGQFSHAELGKAIKEAHQCPHNWNIRLKLAKDGKAFNLFKIAVKASKTKA